MSGLVKMMCSASKGQNWARRSQLIPAEIARSLLPLACCPELSARTIRWNHQLELSVLVNVNSGDTHSHRSGVWEQLCEHDDWSREPMAENICNEVEELLWCTGEGCCQGEGALGQEFTACVEKTKFLVFGPSLLHVVTFLFL